MKLNELKSNLDQAPSKPKPHYFRWELLKYLTDSTQITFNLASFRLKHGILEDAEKYIGNCSDLKCVYSYLKYKNIDIVVPEEYKLGNSLSYQQMTSNLLNQNWAPELIFAIDNFENQIFNQGLVNDVELDLKKTVSNLSKILHSNYYDLDNDKLERYGKGIKVFNKDIFFKLVLNYFKDPARYKSGVYTVIDISKVSKANSLGSKNGDIYIRSVLNKIVKGFEKVLSPAGYSLKIGRIGGDEFALLITNNEGKEIGFSQLPFFDNFIHELASGVEFDCTVDGESVIREVGGLKNNIPPKFYNVDQQLINTFRLGVIADLPFMMLTKFEKIKLLGKLYKAQNKLQNIFDIQINLNSNPNPNSYGDVISNNSKSYIKKARDCSTKDEKLCDQVLNYCCVDPFSNQIFLTFSDLDLNNFEYICYVEPPFLKEINDSHCSVRGDLYKAEFEIMVHEILVKYPHIIPHLRVFQKGHKYILGITKDSNLKSSEVLKLWDELSGIKVAVPNGHKPLIVNPANLQIDMDNMPIPIYYTRVLDGDLTTRENNQAEVSGIKSDVNPIENLDYLATVYWLIKVLAARSSVFNSKIMEQFLFSIKKGIHRTRELDSLFNQSLALITTYFKKFYEIVHPAISTCQVDSNIMEVLEFTRYLIKTENNYPITTDLKYTDLLNGTIKREMFETSKGDYLRLDFRNFNDAVERLIYVAKNNNQEHILENFNSDLRAFLKSKFTFGRESDVVFNNSNSDLSESLVFNIETLARMLFNVQNNYKSFKNVPYWRLTLNQYFANNLTQSKNSSMVSR